MFKSQVIIAARNLFKRKGYTILNMLGLSIGICCCLLIFQYVSYEKSFDGFQKQGSQVYRVRLDNYHQGTLQWKSATSYPGIAPALKRDYPEVEDYCRLIDWSGILANPVSDVKYNETKGYYSDPASISMLGVPLLQGNPAIALSQPNEIIISESMAKKYFGKADVVGKQLEVRAGNAPSKIVYQVSGVFSDYPQNSHLAINYLVSWATLEEEMRMRGDTSNSVNTSFGWYDFYTYIKLKQGTDLEAFDSKLAAFTNKYMNSQERYKTNKIKCELSLIPLSDIHLYSNYNQEAEVNGNGQAVSFIFLIAFFIMGIAWINYINLATARSVERAKEVGIRKVLGAFRNALITQFLLESVLLNLLALVIGLVFAYLLAPSFNAMMGLEVADHVNILPKYALLFTSIFVLGTILSGLYPAFILSGYKPVKVLKGAYKNTAGGLTLRKGLIVFQFGVSVILIVGTIIVYQQVNYMRNQKLGANINQNLVIEGPQTISDSLYQNTFGAFKNDLAKIPAVKSITGSTNVMGQEIYWTRSAKRLELNASVSTLYLLGIDYDFIPHFEMQLAAGRNYSRDFPSDLEGHNAIINEEAVKILGFKNPNDALNKKITINDTLTIVGVLKSVHHLGLQKPIDPQLLVLIPNSHNNYSIKISGGNIQSSIASIEKTWKSYFPKDPFNYFFLDEFYNKQYKGDQDFGKMFSLFAILAILIACFGLLGLSSYNVLQRTKEVSIRKVLGASLNHILFLLSKDFLLLVALAFLLAVPVGWWIMSTWLKDFAYRISINVSVFVIAGIIASAIAVITISFQAIKTAIANPVKSLKNE